MCSCSSLLSPTHHHLLPFVNSLISSFSDFTKRRSPPPCLFFLMDRLMHRLMDELMETLLIRIVSLFNCFPPPLFSDGQIARHMDGPILLRKVQSRPPTRHPLLSPTHRNLHYLLPFMNSQPSSFSPVYRPLLRQSFCKLITSPDTCSAHLPTTSTTGFPAQQSTEGSRLREPISPEQQR